MTTKRPLLTAISLCTAVVAFFGSQIVFYMYYRERLDVGMSNHLAGIGLIAVTIYAGTIGAASGLVFAVLAGIRNESQIGLQKVSIAVNGGLLIYGLYHLRPLIF